MNVFKRLFNRSTKLSKNLVFSILIKIAALVISFFSTTAYMRYFNNDLTLGVWFTVLSIIGWILNFDLGLGNGLRNKLAPTYGEDNQKSKSLVSSTYISLGIISAILYVIFQIVALFLNWNKILNISLDVISNKTLIIALSISILGVCLQLWLRTIVSIYYSIQKNAIGDAALLVTNILLLLFLSLAKVDGQETRLITLSIWYVIAVTLPLIILTLGSFLKPFSKIRPNIKAVDFKLAKTIMKIGSQFFIIQISLLIMNATNQWLVSFLSGPEDVVTYQLYYKVFEIAVSIFSLFTQPVWSAVTVAYQEKRIGDIKKMYYFLLIIATIGFLGALGAGFGLQTIFNIWLQEQTITMNLKTALLFVALVTIQMFIYASTSIANGVSKLKTQIIFTPIGAIIKIPLAFLIYHFTKEWDAVIIAFVVSQIPLFLFQILSLVKFFKNEEKKKIQLVANESL